MKGKSAVAKERCISIFEGDPIMDWDFVCPKCGTALSYHNGVESQDCYMDCPKCLDFAYDPDTGTKLGRVV